MWKDPVPLHGGAGGAGTYPLNPVICWQTQLHWYKPAHHLDRPFVTVAIVAKSVEVRSALIS